MDNVSVSVRVRTQEDGHSLRCSFGDCPKCDDIIYAAFRAIRGIVASVDKTGKIAHWPLEDARLVVKALDGKGTK